MFGIWRPYDSAPAGAPTTANRLPGMVSSQSLVRDETNDQSVPVALWPSPSGARLRQAGGALNGGEVIARTNRGPARGHDLPAGRSVIDQKIGALQAAPLAGWQLPPYSQTLRLSDGAGSPKGGAAGSTFSCG